MKTIEVYEKGEKGYAKTFQFAQRVYLEKLNAPRDDAPDYLFSTEEGDRVFGCMGLNRTIQGSIFVRDERLQFLLHGNCAEQSILAVENCAYGLLVLIAATARYAYHLGHRQIIFAGIDVSLRSLKRFGFTVEEIGFTREDILLPEERPIYEKWISLHQPIICLLETHQSLVISPQILHSFSKRVKLSDKLQKIFN